MDYEPVRASGNPGSERGAKGSGLAVRFSGRRENAQMVDYAAVVGGARRSVESCAAVSVPSNSANLNSRANFRRDNPMPSSVR